MTHCYRAALALVAYLAMSLTAARAQNSDSSIFQPEILAHWQSKGAREVLDNFTRNSSKSFVSIATQAGGENEAFEIWTQFPLNPPYAIELGNDDALVALGDAISKTVASGNEVEQIVSDVMVARILWSFGRLEEAHTLFKSIEQEAIEAGFGDREISSVLADISKIALKMGFLDEARIYFARAVSCPLADCQDDFAIAFAQAVKAGPSAIERAFFAERIAAAERFIDARLGGEPNIRIDFYRAVAEQLSRDRPVDAGKYAERHFAMMVSADGRSIDDIVRAGDYAVWENLLAGRYQAAARVGEKVLLRDLSELTNMTSWLELWKNWLRVLHRLDREDLREQHEFLIAFLEEADWLWNNDTLNGRFQAHNEFLKKYALDVLDTGHSDLLARVLALLEKKYNEMSLYSVDLFSLQARLAAQMGNYTEAARLISELTEKHTFADEKRGLKLAFDIQKASYLELAGQLSQAQDIRSNVGSYSFDLDRLEDIEFTQQLRASAGRAEFTDIFWFREYGNYEGAAYLISQVLDKVPEKVASGTYRDAQRLWQYAFTLARAGEQSTAFQIMDRAARVASNLSFDDARGSGGGSLQLLERDKERYLLFIDIAWNALRGEAPQDMVVLSRP